MKVEVTCCDACGHQIMDGDAVLSVYIQVYPLTHPRICRADMPHFRVDVHDREACTSAFLGPRLLGLQPMSITHKDTGLMTNPEGYEDFRVELKRVLPEKDL